MMMTKRWNVNVGEIRDEISGDLLVALGYEGPYSNDETNTARYNNNFSRSAFPHTLASAYAKGLRGDAAALEAIRVMEDNRAANALETARQKVAELEVKAAENRRSAEGIALAREREARRARGEGR
jgi:hypothetical protein